ncbi:MAG: dTDP-4-dehydrorhamnose 3,5-epimerase [Armatimonadetes bacterium]|nr:dTDP-4-dehydrorhamnose 3,5-epimerase [Armatimonadota bacterium]
MKFEELPLKGAYVIDIEPRADDRGMFARAFCARELAEHGLKSEVAQCNLSHNLRKGTLRGMHYQVPPFAEVKMIRCVRGAIYDAIIDLRRDSPTFLKWTGVELTDENRRAIYVPEGFAHGYQSLTDASEAFYIATQFYAPNSERGIRWNDPLFNIQWPIADPVLSPKDAAHEDFKP